MAIRHADRTSAPQESAPPTRHPPHPGAPALSRYRHLLDNRTAAGANGPVAASSTHPAPETRQDPDRPRPQTHREKRCGTGQAPTGCRRSAAAPFSLPSPVPKVANGVSPMPPFAMVSCLLHASPMAPRTAIPAAYRPSYPSPRPPSPSRPGRADIGSAPGPERSPPPPTPPASGKAPRGNRPRAQPRTVLRRAGGGGIERHDLLRVFARF